MSTAAVPAPAMPAGPTDAQMAAVVATPLRADLEMGRQLFRGNEYYVIKDPLALTYFRLRLEEGFLIMLLDGKRTFGEVMRLFHERFPHRELSIQDLAQFVNQMATAGLLNVNARRFVSSVRAQQSLGKSWLLVWGKMITGLLFLRIPLIDPFPWLGGLTKPLRFVWTRWFVGLCCAFILWSAFWLFINRAEFAQNTINFFSSENLFLVWLTIIFVKTCHEFGHAMTCRHFGGEVHEMGICLICFTPAGYVDASDAWMMPKNSHKIYVTIAGIFTEFVLAGIAAHIWLYLPDGLAKNLAFNAMIVASVNTIFFNANPLMRFDGYYVMSDLLQIPNLRSKSMSYCSFHVQRLLLGYRNLVQERAIGDEHNSRVFIIYAILAYVYMMTVIYGLTKVFGRVLAPYGLHDFGLAVGIFVEGSFAMFPIVKVFSDAFTAGPGNIVREERASRRVARWLVPLVVVVVVLALVPSHFRVRQQAVVVPQQSAQAGVEIGGIVREVKVHTGQWVEAGEPLLLLHNPEVELEARTAELSFDSAKVQLAAMESGGSLERTSLAPEAALALDSASTGLDRARRRLAELVVRSPMAGYVVTPDIDRLEGQYLQEGFPGLRVADQRKFKLLIPLTEPQAELVELGSPVEGHLRADGQAIEAKLSVLPSQKASWEVYQPAMVSAFGGPAPIETKKVRGQKDPQFSIFIAEADMETSPPQLTDGLRAKVTIIGRPATYAERLWRWIMSLWRRQKF